MSARDMAALHQRTRNMHERPLAPRSFGLHPAEGMESMTRRQFVLAAASMPVLAWSARAHGSASPSIAALLDEFIRQAMLDSPQLMTSVGLVGSWTCK